MDELEDRHRIALARELTAAAGVPLRDRYGFAALDEHVLRLVTEVAAHPDDEVAVNQIGALNAMHEIEIAEDGCPTSEETDYRIVAALRPLIEQRRTAAGRALS